MPTVYGLYLVALSVVLLIVIRTDAVSGRCQLFSTRNFLILGLILFQSVSGSLTLFTEQTERGSEISGYTEAGFMFCLILTLFLIIMLTTYRWANGVERFALRRTRIRQTSKARLVLAGVALSCIGIVLRFAGSEIPYVAVLLPQLSAGCLCGGIAFIAMAWARSAFNVFIAIVLSIMLVANSAVLLVGAFGRREILGLLFAVIWALYHEKWQFMPVTRLIPRVAVASIGMAAVILVFSSSRVGGENVDRSLAMQLERLVSIDPRAVEENVMAALSGQFAGGISMWIYDERAAAGGHYPLHSLVYFVTLPIPRDFWPEKPEGLGLTVVDEAGITGVSEGHSWGPGLVGHLVHDIVYFSLPIYAVIIGLVFRYMDVRTAASTRDPVTIALFGSALGQILGMPRGDIGLFAFNLSAAFLGVWFFGRIVGAMFLPIDRVAEFEAREGIEPDMDEGFADDGENASFDAGGGGAEAIVPAGVDDGAGRGVPTTAQGDDSPNRL